MKHNIPVPETIELETLIGPACDGLSGPDPVRLQAVRDGLHTIPAGTRSQKKLNRWPWWAVLLLTGGLATAGWLAGTFLSGDENPDQDNSPAGGTGPGTEVIQDNVHLQRPMKTEQDPTPDSPVIYQRENF